MDRGARGRLFRDGPGKLALGLDACTGKGRLPDWADALLFIEVRNEGFAGEMESGIPCGCRAFRRRALLR